MHLQWNVCIKKLLTNPAWYLNSDLHSRPYVYKWFTLDALQAYCDRYRLTSRFASLTGARFDHVLDGHKMPDGRKPAQLTRPTLLECFKCYISVACWLTCTVNRSACQRASYDDKNLRNFTLDSMSNREKKSYAGNLHCFLTLSPKPVATVPHQW